MVNCHSLWGIQISASSGTISSENTYMFMLIMQEIKIITYLFICLFIIYFFTYLFIYIFKGMHKIQVEIVIVILESYLSQENK